MKKLGLVFKIWLAMFALVVMVLGLSAVFHSGMIERIYLGQQSDRILDRAGRFAREYQDMDGQAEIDRQVGALAGELDANVLLIDQGAGVVSWSTSRGMGMGMGMGRKGMGMGYGRMQGAGVPFSQSDVQSVLRGETLVKRESNQFFGADVITVAVPIKKGGLVSGAVLVYTPLAPIQANLRSIEEAGIYSLLLGLAVSTLLAFLFSRSVTRPILRINEVARAMAGGDYSLKVPVRPDNELGVLADSIDTLSGQLREKMETIERIDATRRNFVASISHELRTPLTIMQGYTEALMDGMARDDRQREKYLMNIYEETLRLRRLVDDLLDLRRLESGMISMRMDRADISGIIESVAGQINQAQAEKKVTVTVHLPVEKLVARGDPDRIRQVLINLVDNAVRFSPENGEVKVSGDRDGEIVRVLVTDQGPGLTGEEKKLVWDRFYKADSSRAGKDSGSGMGLAIARQIIELHGGKIGIESSQGQGSTFWFTLEGLQGN